MSRHDKIGIRMKDNYESISKYRLTRRMPVIIRIDGKAFHTFTRGFNKPFDPIMTDSMQQTMKYLCENIQNCVLGYTQSDEISLLLIDYKTLSTEAWFDNEVQKICSISASLATYQFNKVFHRAAIGFLVDNNQRVKDGTNTYKDDRYADSLVTAINRGGMFDSRCFNIPREEVTNYFYWRQLDAIRNSIASVGQHYFSQRELHGKNCNEIQDMLYDQKDVNWNDYSAAEKRGTCCIKTDGGWVVDAEIPIFKGTGRIYIDKYIDEELDE